MLNESAKVFESEIRLELYKSLRAEVVSYVEKVPALWLQKFVLVGGVVAFIVTNRGPLKGSNDLLTAAILVIPILAILLDAKMAEYALHARAVSNFIRTSFPGPSVAANWESTLWGDQGTLEMISLVKLRSLMTAVVTAVPTIILIIVSGLAVDDVRGRGVPSDSREATFFYWALLISVVYVLVATVMWYKVWPGRRTREQGNLASNPEPQTDGPAGAAPRA